MEEHHTASSEPDRDTELFVEFANTLEFDDGSPVEHLPDARSMRAWLAEHELCGARAPLRDLDAALPAFRDLRSLIHEVAGVVAAGGRPGPGHLRRINGVLRDGVHYHELRPGDDGAAYRMGHVGDELSQARATIAGSLAHYLAEHDLRRVRVCANDGCRWVFVDDSPAGRRRWCDMRTCGNRAKVARHRARARARACSGEAAPAPGAAPARG